MKLPASDPALCVFSQSSVTWDALTSKPEWMWFRKQYKTPLRLMAVPIVRIWKTKYPSSYIASIWR